MIVAILPGQTVDNITLHNITCITYTQYYPDRLSATLPAYYVHTITYTDCQQQLFQLLLKHSLSAYISRINGPVIGNLIKTLKNQLFKEFIHPYNIV